MYYRLTGLNGLELLLALPDSLLEVDPSVQIMIPIFFFFGKTVSHAHG